MKVWKKALENKKRGNKIVHILNGIAIGLFIVYMGMVYVVLKKTKKDKR
jgi:hypothetical protein